MNLGKKHGYTKEEQSLGETRSKMKQDIKQSFQSRVFVQVTWQEAGRKFIDMIAHLPGCAGEDAAAKSALI